MAASANAELAVSDAEFALELAYSATVLTVFAKSKAACAVTLAVFAWLYPAAALFAVSKAAWAITLALFALLYAEFAWLNAEVTVVAVAAAELVTELAVSNAACAVTLAVFAFA